MTFASYLSAVRIIIASKEIGLQVKRVLSFVFPYFFLLSPTSITLFFVSFLVSLSVTGMEITLFAHLD